MQYIKQQGKESIERRLSKLEQMVGERFQRVPGWDRI